MIGDLEAYQRMYPGDFREPGFMDIVHILIVLLLFLVVYIYVRFVENELNHIIRSKTIPFIRYNMRLNGIINFVDSILKIEIFNYKKKI
jgi:hypothetical protein